MYPDPKQERRQAHAYLDHLPDAQLSAVRSLLETMLDPVSRALANAPAEDEEIGAEEDGRPRQSGQTEPPANSGQPKTGVAVRSGAAPGIVAGTAAQ